MTQSISADEDPYDRTRISDHGVYWFATPKLFSEMTVFDSNYVLGCGFHPLTYKFVDRQMNVQWIRGKCSRHRIRTFKLTGSKNSKLVGEAAEENTWRRGGAG